jgi:hypothetical protein
MEAAIGQLRSDFEARIGDVNIPIAQLAQEMGSLRSDQAAMQADVAALKGELPGQAIGALVEQLRADVEGLRADRSGQGHWDSGKVNDFPQSRPAKKGKWKDAKRSRMAPYLARPAVAQSVLDSLILNDLPQIFNDFIGKEFQLLWRGSRDGFSAEKFHNCCDDHPNTLTIIQDTEGFIFGGFTPVKWDSNSGPKVDSTQQSFVFTIVNPSETGAQRFGLKGEKKGTAIQCHRPRGPHFGDIVVASDCAENMNSSVNPGQFYAIPREARGLGSIFTRSNRFRVREIEVFEIIG